MIFPAYWRVSSWCEMFKQHNHCRHANLKRLQHKWIVKISDEDSNSVLRRPCCAFQSPQIFHLSLTLRHSQGAWTTNINSKWINMAVETIVLNWEAQSLCIFISFLRVFNNSASSSVWHTSSNGGFTTSQRGKCLNENSAVIWCKNAT